MSVENPILAGLFLLLSALMSGTSAALHRLGRLYLKEEFPSFFLFQFSTKGKWDRLLFLLSSTKQILQLLYALSAFVFLNAILVIPQAFLLNIALIIVISLIVDFATTLIASAKPRHFLKLFSYIAVAPLFVFCPLTLLLHKIYKYLFIRPYPYKSSPSHIREKILEVLGETDLTPYLDPHDQKLILSVATFKERIAREVMVPRIDIYSLPATTTIQEAAQCFLKEGYSRIPVYRESVDHIIGVLLYKEVLNSYVSDTNLDEPIESLLKPVLYTPETKRISNLLQEFRNKHIHLAIVVDEYGGTEGIVTIEDILEELVGEIADEYDIAEAEMYSIAPSGGWIVDAKMSILDIEEDLGIRIPQSAEYDTIGGYIFHRAGAIPTKGWKIHHDEFDLEILSSNERSIDKIRITPHFPAAEFPPNFTEKPL